MTTTVDAGPELAFGEGGDPMLGYLWEVLAAVGGLASPGVGGAVDDAARVDRISVLKKVKAAVAGAQAAEIVRFARSQVSSQRDAGVDYRRLGAGDRGAGRYGNQDGSLAWGAQAHLGPRPDR